MAPKKSKSRSRSRCKSPKRTHKSKSRSRSRTRSASKSKIVKKLGITKDPAYIYFVEKSSVYKKKRGGKTKSKVASIGKTNIDHQKYFYFVTKHGDVGRAKRGRKH
jgi:hypothetical protein